MLKASLITKAEQELLKPDSYLFDSLKQQLIKAEVDEKQEIMITINIFMNETVESMTHNKLKLHEKYLSKFKTLSILTHLFGVNNYNINQLAKLINSTRQNCLKLLIDASIYNLISISIDQRNNTLTVLRTCIRERQSSRAKIDLLSGKLIQIQEKNNRIDRDLKGVLEQIDEKGLEKKELSLSRKQSSGIRMGLGF